jgi:hypothetical protein
MPSQREGTEDHAIDPSDEAFMDSGLGAFEQRKPSLVCLTPAGCLVAGLREADGES